MKNLLTNFYNSDLFIIISLLFSVISWTFGIEIPILIYVIINVYLIYYLKVSKEKLFVFFASILISFSRLRYSNDIKFIIILAITAILIIIPLIIDFVKKFKYFKMDNIVKSLLLLIFIMILSLLKTEKLFFPLKHIGNTIIVTFLIYYFNNSIKNTSNTRIYISKILLYLSLAISLEFLIYFIKNYNHLDPYYIFSSKDINFGWSISNHFVMILGISFPFTIYLFLETKKKIYLIFLLIIFLTVIFTVSRGAYLGFLFMLFVFIIFLIIYKNQNIFNYKNILFISILITIIIILSISFIPSLKEIINRFKIMGITNPNGRQVVFKVAWDNFKENPILGTGVNTAKFELEKKANVSFYYYHNYILQSLSTMGIIGLIGFIIFIFNIFKNILKTNKLYMMAMILMMTYLLTHGLVDTTFYLPLIMYFLVIILSTVNSNINNIKEETI